MPEIVTFDTRASQVRKTVLSNKGEAPSPKEKAKEGMLSSENVRASILTDMKSAVKQMDTLRKSGSGINELPVDIDLESFVKMKFGFGSIQSFYNALGVDPTAKSIMQLQSMPDFDEGFRWLVPEIIREAVRLGLRRNPIYPNLIASEEGVSQLQLTMPHINMSAARMEVVNETETIPVGNLSFGQRSVRIRKIGTGLKISDEVAQYVPLNILSIYLQDAGVQLGLGLDTMAIDVLINGDAEGNNPAPVIGVKTEALGIQYVDILRAWIRLGLLGKAPTAIIGDEDAAIKIMELAEFKGANYNNVKQNINIITPIPQSQNFFVHGNMPGNGGVDGDEKLGFICKPSALLKLNATGIMVESERIAERQLSATYVSTTTGFVKLFQDAFILLDGNQAFSSAGFPSWMNVAAAENIVIN